VALDTAGALRRPASAQGTVLGGITDAEHFIPIALLLVLVVAAHAAIGVDEAQERRIRSGLRLFRAVLAADEDIASKTDSSGALCLTVVTSR
jgi:hypothetical protein